MTRGQKALAAAALLTVCIPGVAARGAGASSGDPAAALAELRREIAGPRPPSLSEQSRRLARIGEAYLAAGEEGRAVELLSEAAADDPSNGDAVAELTLAYVRHGDLEFAEFYLDTAIRSNRTTPQAAGIFRELGALYAERNRTSEALRAWEEAIRLGGDDPEIRARMGKLRRDWAYGHGQQYLEGNGFEVFYDPDVPVAAVESTLQYLDERRAELASFFGAPLATSPVVILYQGRRYFSWMDTPDWVGGVYDGRIHVPLPPDGAGSESYRALLSHELAHAFITEMTAGRAPGWLQEGLAQYVEGRRISAEEAGQSLSVVPLDTVADLSAAFSQRSDRDRARAAYRLALFCVQDFVTAHGAAAAACLLRDLASGMSVESAIRAESGTDFAALERGWRDALRAALPPPRRPR